ncbi:MAG TPA: 50S ribosomal protein L29 [Elusimicrobia bacterium]|nr:MAG: 50S ribosomal protein L29 [Elusimicrobia bacterium RIFOXYA12_FULL_49_49]OGS06133.1 MAG: 50S ribosomal protein L29 [Elusimicrobia bacterium RIFOXYA1_FULL_47_7]OGS09462.1 MAG: 50S ribosomal protein L29 [Elusimicrobia bacterium RIFOXYB1_FULL_48_9]OGS14595.1 MAG: 50S ribosomal protein L29 [Elusimicrobia bacterium RIFOXYA2_FULL_47_53]OGS25751.1 MAG: 50S ribosomal protein L29 [Elusimicrobia bacterium RIFOXYB12_FULL_50_12]OGS31686.1 MAG: 50S ribosomal protein L29 [Elusimicrobia bacterium RIFO
MKAKIWQEMKNLSATELEAKLRESEEKLFRLKFKHTTTPLKNPLEIRSLRKVVAKLKTLIKQQSVKKA